MTSTINNWVMYDDNRWVYIKDKFISEYIITKYNNEFYLKRQGIRHSIHKTMESAMNAAEIYIMYEMMGIKEHPMYTVSE